MLHAVVVAMRFVAMLAFAVAAIGQTALYWGILAEHKPTASRAYFGLLRIPRAADLTPRGLVLRTRWWRVTALAVVSFVVMLALRGR